MSREILFRGKRTDSREWMEGNLITDEKEGAKTYIGYLFGVQHGLIEDFDIAEVDPSTVCQYTGLTDRNGVKIWEGDIIQSFGRRYVVMYYNDRAAFMRAEINANVYVYLSRYSMRNEFEVVGNRWDTPELLKGGTGEDD